jgi:hypothetical protein
MHPSTACRMHGTITNTCPPSKTRLPMDSAVQRDRIAAAGTSRSHHRCSNGSPTVQFACARDAPSSCCRVNGGFDARDPCHKSYRATNVHRCIDSVVSLLHDAAVDLCQRKEARQG